MNNILKISENLSNTTFLEYAYNEYKGNYEATIVQILNYGGETQRGLVKIDDFDIDRMIEFLQDTRKLIDRGMTK